MSLSEGHSRIYHPEILNPKELLNPEELHRYYLLPFVEFLKKNKYNIVISTTAAGAGHWRQAERLVRFFDLLGLGNQITFVATDRTTKKTTSITDFILKAYPRLQNYYTVAKLIRLLMNSPLGARIVDKQVLKMAEQGERDMMEILKESKTFDESNPTLFISTHSMLAGGAGRILEKRNNPGDWLVEYVPDPWKDSDLRAMTVPHVGNSHWITVVHDKETASYYKRIRPDSQAIVVPWGTLSNPIYLERRQHLKSGEVKMRERMDVIIECSGSYIPEYDAKIISFIHNNVEAIKKGEIRLVIDPMFHRKSYESFLEELKKVGLDKSPNLLLLNFKHDINRAVKRREDVIERKNVEVENYFGGNFDPFAVIVKGGEVPLEDRADMVVFCPFASVPHEVDDIKAGVREGRAVDARQIHPSEWFLKLKEIFEKRCIEQRNLPEPSMALLAPVLIYLLIKHKEYLEERA